MRYSRKFIPAVLLLGMLIMFGVTACNEDSTAATNNFPQVTVND